LRGEVAKMVLVIEFISYLHGDVSVLILVLDLVVLSFVLHQLIKPSVLFQIFMRSLQHTTKGGIQRSHSLNLRIDLNRLVNLSLIELRQL